jgi:hypothetical protein
MQSVHSELEQVQSVVVRITHHIDAKKWSELRALYADVVETDYTSLGGAHAKEPAEALVGRWKTALGQVTTQHLLGPIDVNIHGSSARAECHVRASHHARGLPGGDSWLVVGHYVIDLIRHADTWRIVKMLLQTFQQEGNSKLLEEVAK